MYEDDRDLAAGNQDIDHLVVNGPLAKDGFNDGVMCPRFPGLAEECGGAGSSYPREGSASYSA